MTVVIVQDDVLCFTCIKKLTSVKSVGWILRSVIVSIFCSFSSAGFAQLDLFAPIAGNDAASTLKNVTVTIDVVANDHDPDVLGGINAKTVDLDVLNDKIQDSNDTPEGKFKANSSGVVTFDPKADFTGVASLAYTVEDNEAKTSNVATITITVIAPPNVAPVAQNDAASTDENTSVTVDVVSNDSDSDGSINEGSVDLNTTQAGIQNSNSTTQGSYTVNDNGVVTFQPAANFSGTATLSYAVNDNDGAASNIATITITVNPVNAAPVAVNDNATTNEGSLVTFSIVANDTDSDGTINVASVDLNPSLPGVQKTINMAQGNFSVNGSGEVTFTPAANFSGQVSIDYTVEDNENATSNTAIIKVTVSAVNASPVAVNDNANTSEGTTVTLNIVINDTDSDGTVNVSSVDLNPSASGNQKTLSTAQGNFSVNNSGIVTYTPVANFSGQAAITYTVQDNEDAVSNVASITITVSSVNAPPLAVDDNANTNEGTPVSFNIISNDIDGDGTVDAPSVDLNLASSGLQKSINTPQGNFTVNNSGVVTYTPASNFSGQVSIDYTVRDNEGATSNIATITVTVGSVNASPVAGNDNVSTSEGTPVLFNVVLNDSDSDGNVDATSVDLNPGSPGQQKSNSTPQGNFTVDNSGVVTFNPVVNFSGQSSISYTVEDNENAISNVATITVTVSNVNAPPTASDDVANTDEGAIVSFNILSNDTDSDGSLDASTVDLNPSSSGVEKDNNTPQGKFVVNPAGLVTFTPTSGFSGLASINYTVKDNESATSNIANITVAVGSVNIPPTANDDNANTSEGIAVSLNILTNDTDSDGTIVATTIDINPAVAGTQKDQTTAQGNFTVNQSGVVTFTPVAGFFGEVSITYTVQDNEGGTSNNAAIKITVNSVNAVPVASNDNSSTEQGAPISMDVLSNDTDSDGTIEASSVDLNPAEAGNQKEVIIPEGKFEVNSAGTVKYTPSQSFLGVATVSYTVLDNEGAISNAASIRVEVGYEGVVDLDIPTGFTPNGDGANETWKIQPKDKGSLDYFPNAEIRVYSKRGVLVFEGLGFESAWDGRHRGNLLPADTYYYTIDLRRGSKTHKGIVTILR